MKLKKIGWLIFCCLVVAGLVLASCGPAAEEEEEEEEAPSDEPQYGGIVTQIVDRDTRNFDDVNPWE